MIKHKNTFVDITGIVLDGVTHYLVTYTRIYEFSLFGRLIKEYKNIEEVPFVFKSFEIAKDFCELNPKYKKYTFYEESTYGSFKVYYRTYKIVLNNKVNAYVIWNHNILTYDYTSAEYQMDESYPIVNGFIKDELNNIILPTSRNEISLSIKRSPKTPHMVEKLSDIFAISKTDKHHFELIENNEEG